MPTAEVTASAKAHRLSGTARLVGIVLPAALTVAARWPSLHQPLDRDMAAYATIGAAMWKGLLPYRDLFDHKQPLVYPVYAAIDLLAPSTSAVRVAGMAAAMVTVVAVAVLTRPLLGRWRSAMAACIIAVVSATPYVEGFDLNTEHLLAPVTATAVLLSLRYRHHRWMPAVVGFLLGLAVITKVVAVFVGPAMLLPLICMPFNRRDLRRRLVMFAGAACLPTLAVVLVYAAAGGLGSLIEANITYNRSYVAALAPALDRFIQPSPVFIASLAAAAAMIGASRLLLVTKDRPDVMALLLWLFGAWVGAKFGGRDFPHYFAPVVAPAVILLLMPLGPTVQLTRLRRPARILLAGQLALLGACLRMVPTEMARLFNHGPSDVALLIFGEQARVWTEYEPVGAEIRARAEPTDTLFVAGAEPGFYWFSGASVAGRYPYDYPVLADPLRLRELQQDLCRTRPSRVLLPYGAAWPAYLSMLNQSSYRLEFTRGSVHVFRQIEDAQCLPVRLEAQV